VYSPGFPISKAEEYVRLRKPYCVNNVSAEHVLRDRRLFYHVLARHGVPVPRHIFMIRAGPVEKHSTLEERDDYIVVDGVRMDKPFVEKPVDANVRAGLCSPLAIYSLYQL
jgi:inositol-hexakisphosphate/diphosphoinositol-pentakisphosphate 1-kinase